MKGPLVHTQWDPARGPGSLREARLAQPGPPLMSRLKHPPLMSRLVRPCDTGRPCKRLRLLLPLLGPAVCHVQECGLYNAGYGVAHGCSPLTSPSRAPPGSLRLVMTGVMPRLAQPCLAGLWGMARRRRGGGAYVWNSAALAREA